MKSMIKRIVSIVIGKSRAFIKKCRKSIVNKAYNYGLFAQYGKRYLGNYYKYEVDSLYSYCKRKNCILNVVDNSTEKLVRKPNEVFVNESFECAEKQIVTINRIYWCLLTNVYAIGETDGYIIDNKYISERADWDLIGLPQELPESIICASEKDTVFCYNAADTYDVDCAISFLKMWSYNIFHLIFEVISRLPEIDKIEDYKNWPILLDEGIRKDSRSVDIINRINVNNRKIIWVKRKQVVYANQLIVPPTYVWSEFDYYKRKVSRFGIALDGKAVNEYKKLILKDYRPRKHYHKVYISRGNNNRMVNEDEVIGFLKDEGFEIFCPDKGGLNDEIDCFSTAEFIVVMIGAATANIVYCKRNVVVYQICPYSFITESGLPIADELKIEMKIVDANIIKEGRVIGEVKFSLPLSSCKEIVDDINSRKG